MDEVFAVQSPEQLRAFADPFRQRLLGVLATPHTVKAAAERLGAPLSRLYHHIDLLLGAGLIEVVAERRRRATVERTFQATARRFEVAPGALGGAGAGGGEARSALEGLLAAGAGPPRIAHATLRLTPERLALLEQKLGDLLEALESPDGLETEILLIASPQGSATAQA
jgi:DNA-binding transcriptional ArsR family regulator